MARISAPDLGAAGITDFVLGCLCPQAAHFTEKVVGKPMGKTHEVVLGHGFPLHFYQKQSEAEE